MMGLVPKFSICSSRPRNLCQYRCKHHPYRTGLEPEL